MATTLTVPATIIGDFLASVRAEGIRDPDSWGGDGPAPSVLTVTWNVDLTAPEQTAVASLAAQVASGLRPMSSTAYAAVRADIQTLRAFRQRSRNDFIALTQNDRDRALYDAIVATTKVFLALLREPD